MSQDEVSFRECLRMAAYMVAMMICVVACFGTWAAAINFLGAWGVPLALIGTVFAFAGALKFWELSTRPESP